jgi:hypothetical protein
LSIGAVVTLIELAFPNIVPLGFLLLGVPGALLWITPSALIYGSIAALIWRGIPRYRHLKLYMIATSLFAVGIALPETLNHFKNISISKLQQDDIILIQEPTLPDTIAFLFAPAGFNRKEANEINGSTFF